MQDEITTLRKDLNDVGFDWSTGIIISYDTYITGWKCDWELENNKKLIITHDNPILDIEYNYGYGGFEMPYFRAQDKDKIYFPYDYDGSSCVKWVYKNFTQYLETKDTLGPM